MFLFIMNAILAIAMEIPYLISIRNDENCPVSNGIILDINWHIKIAATNCGYLIVLIIIKFISNSEKQDM